MNGLLDELGDGKGGKVLLVAYMDEDGRTKGMVWNSGEMLDLHAVSELLQKMFSEETFNNGEIMH